MFGSVYERTLCLRRRESHVLLLSHVDNHRMEVGKVRYEVRITYLMKVDAEDFAEALKEADSKILNDNEVNKSVLIMEVKE